LFIDSVTASVENQKELASINSRNTARPRHRIGVQTALTVYIRFSGSKNKWQITGIRLTVTNARKRMKQFEKLFIVEQ